jgi:hypothetical protein
MAEDIEDFTFRGMSWGDSSEKVKELEKWEHVVDLDNASVYEGMLFGWDTTLLYGFSADRLTGGIYRFDQTYVNANQYLNDFERVKAALVKKYGEPESDIWRWKDRLYRDKPEMYGDAVERGSLELEAEWDFPDTLIVLSLKGENYEASFTLAYKSLDFIDTMRTELEDEELEAL